MRKESENFGTLVSFDTGWGNGYIGVPKEHPWYEKYYMDIENEYDVDIHGGLTYSGFEDDDKCFWWVGFDTAHVGDTLRDWPRSRVEEEAQRLQRIAINIVKE